MTATPAVSIILPTYNRARFLPAAFESIRGQTFSDWELIVVDDGSTDETPEILEQLAAIWKQAAPKQHVQRIRQENTGAYGARNTGLDHALGRYVAFFDSDDLWLPHHLANCVEALEANPGVDWAYGACRIVDDLSGQVLSESTFRIEGSPRPFLRLRTRTAGALRIIEDHELMRCMILNGLYCGLQNSVLRRRLFDDYRFEAASRNEAEDQLFVIRCLNRGCMIAYYDAVHVIYRVHESNSTAPGNSGDLARRSSVLRLLAEGYERVLRDGDWAAAERRALRRRVQQEYFWKLGYVTLWQSGQREEAIRMFERGLASWPWEWRCWKTYFTARVKHAISFSQGQRG